MQDSNGEHLCNGSYIGENQILFSPDCQNNNIIFPFPSSSPPSLSSLDSSSVVINGVPMGDMQNIEPGVYSSSTPNTDSTQLSDGTLVINGVPISPASGDDIIPILGDGGIIIPSPFPTPNYPVQVAFNLADGTQSAGYPIIKRMTHPFSGDDLIAEVSEVPNGVEALTLASDALLDKLESGQNIEVNVVGRYYSNSSEEIGVKTFTIAPITQCPTLSNDPLVRRLCLLDPTTSPFPTCELDFSNQSSGAPIVYQTGNEKFLLGYKNVTTNYGEGCYH